MMFIVFTSFGQSVVATTASKSAILVGSDTDYAGINYETGSDKFSFNYKLNVQTKKRGSNEFSDFYGVNIGAGIKTEKAKSTMVSDEKWKGAVDFDLTFLYVFDNSKTDSVVKASDGLKPVDVPATIKQTTLYIKVANALERINTYETRIANADTTFISLNNPINTTFTVTPGINKLYHKAGTKFYITGGASANINFISNSTRGLKESIIQPLSGVVLNAKDSTAIQQVGKAETYFAGRPKAELFFVPRADVFARYCFDSKKVAVGLLCSYSPLVSSLNSVKTRNCFAFGPTFGLAKFPSQVVFAIMNEFNQAPDGVYKYALTFQASLPLTFK